MAPHTTADLIYSFNRLGFISQPKSRQRFNRSVLHWLFTSIPSPPSASKCREHKMVCPQQPSEHVRPASSSWVLYLIKTRVFMLHQPTAPTLLRSSQHSIFQAGDNCCKCNVPLTTHKAWFSLQFIQKLANNSEFAPLAWFHHQPIQTILAPKLSGEVGFGVCNRQHYTSATFVGNVPPIDFIARTTSAPTMRKNGISAPHHIRTYIQHYRAATLGCVLPPTASTFFLQPCLLGNLNTHIRQRCDVSLPLRRIHVSQLRNALSPSPWALLQNMIHFRSTPQ